MREISEELLERYFKGLCTEEEAAMVEAFAPRIERFRALYRALAPEFAAARYKEKD